MESINSLILNKINRSPSTTVWTSIDFLELGNRDAVDKTLQRLVNTGKLRRIARGLFDSPSINSLTGKPATPDYRLIIEAIARRDQVRILIDGITAANDLGLTNAIPGKVVVHTEGQLKPIQLDNLTIQFKLAAPSKLYWAGRPAMRIIQALYWFRDSLKSDQSLDQDLIKSKLINLLKSSSQGPVLCKDLQSGIHTLPAWMQKLVTELLEKAKDES